MHAQPVQPPCRAPGDGLRVRAGRDAPSDRARVRALWGFRRRRGGPPPPGRAELHQLPQAGPRDRRALQRQKGATAGGRRLAAPLRVGPRLHRRSAEAQAGRHDAAADPDPGGDRRPQPLPSVAPALEAAGALGRSGDEGEGALQPDRLCRLPPAPRRPPDPRQRPAPGPPGEVLQPRRARPLPGRPAFGPPLGPHAQAEPDPGRGHGARRSLRRTRPAGAGFGRGRRPGNDLRRLRGRIRQSARL